MALKGCTKLSKNIAKLVGLLMSYTLLINPTIALAKEADCIVIGGDAQIALEECQLELSKTSQICNMVLTACESYIGELEGQINLQDLKIKTLESQKQDYEIQLEEELAMPDRWYENPWSTGLLGLVIGAAAWESIR